MKKLVTILVLVWPLLAKADDWPMWRGPLGNGHSTETNLPLRWNNSQNIAWKVPIPGKGHSSPIIWGDKIFLTTAIEEQQKRMLLCLSRTTSKPPASWTPWTRPFSFPPAPAPSKPRYPKEERSCHRVCSSRPASPPRYDRTPS